jgi:hypothetical protein
VKVPGGTEDEDMKIQDENAAQAASLPEAKITQERLVLTCHLLIVTSSILTISSNESMRAILLYQYQYQYQYQIC